MENFSQVVPRRDFIRASASVLALGALAENECVFAERSEARNYRELVGTRFRIEQDGGAVVAELVDVVEKYRRPQIDSLRSESFVLVFEPIHGQFEQDSICACSPSSLATEKIFFSRLGDAGRFQAVFS